MPRKSRNDEKISRYDESSSDDEEVKLRKKSYKTNFRKLAGINYSLSDDEQSSENESESESKSYDSELNLDNDCCESDENSSQSSGEEFDDEFKRSFRSGKQQKQIKKQILPTQEVVFAFNVGTSSKKKILKLNYRDLKIMSVSAPNDFETLSTTDINKEYDRLSKNCDVILKLEINMNSDYPGNVKVDLPTIKYPGNRRGYQGQDFISYIHTPQQHKIVSKKAPFTELINRELTQGQIRFLNNYPGHTTESFPSYCTLTPNKKFINVGIQKPKSCLMHYIQETDKLNDDEKQQLYKRNISKVNGGIFEIPKKLYEELKDDVTNDLEKNYSFSDLTSKDFHMLIYPQMRSTTEKNIKKHISMYEKSNKKEDKELLKMLKKEGFSNFYNTNPDKKTFDAKLKEFEEGVEYAFDGTIKVTYYQVHNINGSSTKLKKSLNRK